MLIFDDISQFYMKDDVLLKIKQMQKLWLVALLPILALTFSANYNYIDLDCDYGACSQDFNTCACVIYNRITIYQRGPSTYLIVGSINPICTSAYNYSCSLNRVFMKGDGSRLMVRSLSDNTYKAYDLTNTSYPLVGTINFNGGTTYMDPMKGDYFIASTTSLFQFFHFEPTNSSYVLNYSYTPPSSAYSQEVGYSSDARLLVYFTFKYGQSDAFFHISELNTANGSYTTTQVPLGLSVTFVNCYGLSVEVLNGNYYAIAILQYSGLYYFRRYLLTGTTATLDSNIVQPDYPNYQYLSLTRNSQFLMTVRQNKLVNLFQLDPGSNTYQHLTTLSPSQTTLSEIFINQNASLLKAKTFISIQKMRIYFNCSVAYCLSCSFIDFCSACQAGYTLSNGSCGCAAGQSMLNGVCISCNIAFCSACSSTDVCSACQSGFQVVNSACVCPTGSTISSTGICVSCNVANCLQCDSADVCVAWSPASTGTISTGTTDANNNTNSNTASLWAVVAIVLVLVVALLVGIMVMIKKMALLATQLKKVRAEEGNRTLNHLNEQRLQEMNSTTKIKEDSAANSPKKLKRRLRQDNNNTIQIEPMTPIEQ